VTLWAIVGNAYKCEAIVNVAGNEKFLLEVRGNHIPGKRDWDVEALAIRNQDLSKFPKGIEHFFPHLRILFLHNTNLWSISAEDLRPFSALMYVNIDTNKIVSLDGDLFKYTPRLLYIDFEKNFLYHVGSGILSGLNYLQVANFKRNPCTSMFANDPHGIQLMNQQLPVKCPKAITKASPVTTTISPDQTKSLLSTESANKCSDGCFNRVKMLEKRIEELNSEVMDLKNSFDQQKDVLKEMSEKVVETSEIVGGYEEKFEEIEKEIKESSICV
jgi:uncharacterized coiled-coil protein SlyX